jgi:hypothetical protein
MRWREDDISGKDAMLGQHPIERLSRLERDFRFLGRDFRSWRRARCHVGATESGVRQRSTYLGVIGYGAEGRVQK